MKQLFSILLFFLIVKTYSQDTIYLHDLNDTISIQKEKALYYKTINFNIHPVEVTSYYVNGVKISTVHYSSLKAIVKDGEYETFFYNGKTNIKGTFINNNMEGTWLIYNREKGFLETKTNFKDNLKNGRSFTFFENGKLSRMDIYVRDTLGLSTCYDSIGNVIECYSVDTSLIYDKVEVMPEFPGKTAAMMLFLQKNIIYPDVARDKGLEGKVIVKYYIDVDGSVKDPFILMDGVGGGCGDEAIRVVKLLPKWKPGSQNGKIVKVYYTLPITFKIH